MKVYVDVYAGMLLLVASKWSRPMPGPGVRRLLLTLVALALLEAAVALLYFMHLRYERRALLWWTVPLVVFAFVMMNHVWPDAFPPALAPQ